MSARLGITLSSLPRWLYLTSTTWRTTSFKGPSFCSGEECGPWNMSDPNSNPNGDDFGPHYDEVRTMIPSWEWCEGRMEVKHQGWSFDRPPALADCGAASESRRKNGKHFEWGAKCLISWARHTSFQILRKHEEEEIPTLTKTILRSKFSPPYKWGLGAGFKLF